jgi:hypothetical protein
MDGMALRTGNCNCQGKCGDLSTAAAEAPPSVEMTVFVFGVDAAEITMRAWVSLSEDGASG